MCYSCVGVYRGNISLLDIAKHPTLNGKRASSTYPHESNKTTVSMNNIRGVSDDKKVSNFRIFFKHMLNRINTTFQSLFIYLKSYTQLYPSFVDCTRVYALKKIQHSK